MNVGLGLSFYNSIKELPRCLGDPEDPNSVNLNVNYIFAIDGRYRFYNSDNDYSTDGSYEFIKSNYNNAVMDKFAGYQTDKRQRYLDLAGEYNCDFLIVMDTDEYIDPNYNNWKSFYSNLEKTVKQYPDENLFYMKCYMNPLWKKAYNKVRNGTWRKYIKIHKNPGNFRYALKKHYMWTRKEYSDEYICEYRTNNAVSNNQTSIKRFLEVAIHTIDGVRINTDSTLRTKGSLKIRKKWALTQMGYENTYEGRLSYKYLTGLELKTNPYENMR